MNLRAILNEKRMTQYALSKASGVSQGQLSQYMSGTKTPGGKVLIKLSKALDCTVDDLLADTNETA